MPNQDPPTTLHYLTETHHIATHPDAVAWLHPQPDGTATLYCIRPGLPTLILSGLKLIPPPASRTPTP